MINFPNKHQLKELRACAEPFCLTIYAPYIDPSAATNPNKIELKNMLAQAEAALLDAGVKPKAVKKTLRPARKLLGNHEFWPMHHESLALFMHPKLFRYYHIPDHATPYVMTVEKGFNLEPLLDVMQDNAPYYLLALSHNQVRLFEGSHYELHPIHPRDLPCNMKEALRIDEYPNWRETHTVAPASSGKGSEAYHGQYNVAQTDKIMLVEFFHLINKRLRKFLSGSNKPLIIGGVDYLLPLYRHTNTYPHLLPGSIKGNLEHAKLDDLRERAWEIVRSIRHEHAIS